MRPYNYAGGVPDIAPSPGLPVRGTWGRYSTYAYGTHATLAGNGVPLSQGGGAAAPFLPQKWVKWVIAGLSWL